MSSRAFRWFGGLVAGLVVISVVTLIPAAGLGPTKVTEAQPYGVLGVAGGEQQAASTSSTTSRPWWRIWGR